MIYPCRPHNRADKQILFSAIRDIHSISPEMAKIENTAASEFPTISSLIVGPEENRSDDYSLKVSKLLQMQRYLAVEVSTNHVDLLLLVCCLVTGFVDSTLYNGMLL